MNQKELKFLLMIWVLALLGGLAPRFAVGQVITSGADFLRIDSGARSEGMGGAYTAVADDVNALTWNPAGLGFLQQTEIGYLRMIYFNDVGYNFGGLAIPLTMGENGMGLGVGVVNLGSSFDSTLGVAPSVTTSDTAFFLSGAYRVKSVFSIGITGKYILRQIAGYNASAFGGDAGILAAPVEHLRIGAGIFNVGQQVQFISASDPLPMTARLGLAYQVLDIPHHSLVFSADGSYLIQAQAYQAAVGAEYWLDKTLALRAGYTGDAYQQHWTAGAGLNISIFQLDYAYAPSGTLGDTHRISFILRFGGDEGGLGAPSGFTANPLDGAVRLAWKPSTSPDVVGYNLYVKRPGAASFVKLSNHPFTDTSAKLGHLQNGMSYSFAVASVSAAGRESSLTQLSVIPGGGAVASAPMGPVLSAPTGLKVSLLSEGLQLSWDVAASPDVVGFNLYLMGEAGVSPKKLTSQPVTETHVNFKKVNPEKTYRFTLTAVTKAGKESDPTAEVAANWSDLSKAAVAPVLAPLGKVTGLTAKAGNKMAKLSWKPVEGAVGYNLYVSLDGRHSNKLNKKGLRKTTTAILQPLKNGKKYYFGVAAVGEDGTEGKKVFKSVVPSRRARK